MSAAAVSRSDLATSINTYKAPASFVPILRSLKDAKMGWTESERQSFWAEYGGKVGQIFPANIIQDLNFAPAGLFQRIVQPAAAAPAPRAVYCAMPTTNDFGTSVRKLRFATADPKKPFSKHLLNNMMAVAKEEGFELIPSKDVFLYFRDHYVRLKDGSVIFCTMNDDILKHLDKAVDRSNSKAIYFQESAMGRASHPYYWSCIGSSRYRLQEAEFDYAQFHSDNQPTRVPFYFEGGDIFTLTNRGGTTKILMGQGHLSMIHCNWRLAKLFDDPQTVQQTGGIKAAEVAKIAARLTDEELRNTAEEMYALGLIGEEKGFLSREKIAQLPGGSLHDTAIQAKAITPFKMEDFGDLRPVVAKFLAQREFILKLLSAHFMVPGKDLHFIPEAAYHLDNFLMPGPHRTVMVQDYGLCIQVLTDLKKEAKALALSNKDLTMLDTYLETAAQLDREIGPVLKKARAEIEKAGFQTISAPGCFADSKTAKVSQHVQFLNGISGWSQKNKRPYFITTGAAVGDRLGNAMMNLFETYLKGHMPDLKVHFVGYDHPNDFSPAMAWWNGDARDCAQAGVRCLSFEEEAVPHMYAT